MDISPPIDPLASDLDEVAAEAIDDNPVGPGLIYLKGVPVPVIGPVQFSELATLYPRLTVGDFTNASDNFFSVWVQSTWTGGGQVEQMRESSHAERYWTGTAETRYAGILAQPPLTHTVRPSEASGTAYPLGDYGTTTEQFYAAFGTKLFVYDATTNAFTEIGTLAGEPVQKAVVYDGMFWIPLGSNGYAVWDGTTLSASSAIFPISMVVWDEKLVALTTDKAVAIWDGSTWMTSDRLRLRGRQRPRHLVAWWSPDGMPTLFVVTDEDMWAVDPDVPMLMRTGLRFPRHPDHGLAAEVWRDDALYVAVGMGVHQVTLGAPPAIAAIGLDRNDGVPSWQRGAIVDFAAEYNGLFALVRGEASASDQAIPASTLEETQIYEEPPLSTATSQGARASLFVWTGFGWHCLWESTEQTVVPTRVVVSQAQDTYRVWWGHGSSLYWQALPRSYHNPSQAALIGSRDFASSSYLVTGEFDANLSAFMKIWSHHEAYLHEESVGHINVWYRTNLNTSWRLLGTYAGQGWQTLPFDPDGDGWAEGDASHWIQLRYELESGAGPPTATPLVRWFALKFLVVPLQTRAWTFTVPLMHAEQFMGAGPDELFQFLDGLAASAEIVPMRHLGRVYRVRVTRVVAGEQVIQQRGRVATVTVAEARIPSDT